jgi:hypothetical protein
MRYGQPIHERRGGARDSDVGYRVSRCVTSVVNRLSDIVVSSLPVELNDRRAPANDNRNEFRSR